MTYSLDDISTQRAIGRWTWAAAWVGLVVGQLHALSRHATEEGRADLELPLTAAWAEPAARLLRPLFDWGDPDLVYVTYGKVWLPLLVSLTLCALVVRRRRAPRGAERWAWRVALTGLAATSVGVTLSYWTQWTAGYNAAFDVGFAVAAPGLLLMLVGSSALGLAMLARHDRRWAPGLLLTLALPLAVALVQATSLGNAVLPVLFAFGLLGRELDRSDPADLPARRAAALP